MGGKKCLLTSLLIYSPRSLFKTSSHPLNHCFTFKGEIKSAIHVVLRLSGFSFIRFSISFVVFSFFLLQRDKSLSESNELQSGRDDSGLPLMQCGPFLKFVPGSEGLETQDLCLHSCSIIYLFHNGPHCIRVNSYNGIDQHCNLERTCHRFYKDNWNTVSEKLKKILCPLSKRIRP